MHSRRLVRGELRLLVALGLLTASAPSMAAQYFFCYVKDYHGSRGMYYSPVYETPVEEVDDTQMGFAFSRSVDHLQRQDYPGVAGVTTGCVSGSNRGYILEQHANHPTWNRGTRQVEWTDPPIPGSPVEKVVHNDGITVEPAPPMGPTPDQIAAQLAGERARAADNARRRAAALRATEELKANERKLIEQARRRGRMQ